MEKTFGIQFHEHIEESVKYNREYLNGIKSIKDIKKFEFNPFILDLDIKEESVYEFYDKYKKEGINFITGKESYKKDKTPFIRLFDRCEINFKILTPNTAKLLLYIIYNKSNYNVSIFYLTNEEIKNELDISVNTIYQSILELIKLQYIAKHFEANLYWINPSKFYKGDRKMLKI